MKNCLLVLFATLLLSPYTLQAQTQRGSIMLGATAGIYFSNHAYIGTHIDPTAGFFVIDQLAIGAAFAFGSENNFDHDSGKFFRGGPFVRYYFNGRGKFRVFGQADFGWISLHPKYEQSETTIDLGASFGADIFLTKSVAIEVSLEYDHYTTGPDFRRKGTDKFGINVGVQGFIGGGGKEE